MKYFLRSLICVTIFIVLGSSCVSTKFKLFTDAEDPLMECYLEGKGSQKVLVITVSGFISDAPQKDFMATQPSMVQEIVSQLALAEQDSYIKAIVLKIDSPGGSTTASDILYNEISEFKKRTGIKIVTEFMNMGTSGAYYIALPSDYIVAHPTSIVGSVGVIFMKPQLNELMKKIGVDVDVTKSGKNKDIGSWFRKSTKEEEMIFDQIISDLAKRFVSLVQQNRKLDQNALDDISTAKIYLAEEAVKVGLIDKVGYINDALRKAKALANLPDDAQVVCYRRTSYPNDNIYNINMKQRINPSISLINLDIPKSLKMQSGFYYMWVHGE